MSGDSDDLPATQLERLAAIAFALFTHLLFAVLAVVGVLIVNVMFRAWRSAEAGTAGAIGIGLFGLSLAAIGIGFFWFAYVGAPRIVQSWQRERGRYRDRPWLTDRRWRARRVVHSIRHTAWFMWFWCVLWWAVMGVIWSFNKELIVADLAGPWSHAIPTALPVVVGIIGLLVAVSLTWQRWRYGDAVLIIDTLPGYLGERFRGRIEARLAEPPHEPVELSLSCGSMTTEKVHSSGGGFETVLVTNELWAWSKKLSPGLTIFAGGRVAVPVDFELPSDLPESGHVLDDPQIVWTLEITPGSVLDRALNAEFQIPVFARRQRTPHDMRPQAHVAPATTSADVPLQP